MPLIPYRTDFQDETAARAEADTRARRRDGHLLNLDRMLLHVPGLADGWGELMSRVRRGYRISYRHRELAICAVARVAKADYEIFHHHVLFLEAGGTEAQAEALKDVARAAENDVLFDATERAILAFALESTRDLVISDRTGAAVLAEFPDPAEVLELTMVIASYNMVSRVLVGLGIECETA